MRKLTRKKIAFFIPTLNSGGAQKVIVTLANTLSSSRDVEVDIVLVKKEGKLLTNVSSEVNLVELGCKRTSFAIPKLVKYIKESEITCLMSSMNYVNVVAVVAKLLSRSNVRLVLREAEVLLPLLDYRSRLFHYSFTRFLMWLSYRFADHVIANSKATKASLQYFGISSANRITTVYNPISLPSYEDNKSLEKDKIILSIGRLSYEKGFDLLIRAFGELGNPTLRLVIVGDGEKKEELINLVEVLCLNDKVVFIDFLSDVGAVLSRASLFVLASRWEGFGNVVVEALGSGVPVLATDCPGGVKEILDYGRYGQLVKPENVSELTEGIKNSLVNPAGTVESRKQRARLFSPKSIGREYLRVFFPD